MKTYRISFFHFFVVVCILSLFACAGGPSERQTQASKEQPGTETNVVHGVEKIQLASTELIPTRAPLEADYDNNIFRSFAHNAQLQKDWRLGTPIKL